MDAAAGGAVSGMLLAVTVGTLCVCIGAVCVFWARVGAIPVDESVETVLSEMLALSIASEIAMRNQTKVMYHIRPCHDIIFELQARRTPAALKGTADLFVTVSISCSVDVGVSYELEV